MEKYSLYKELLKESERTGKWLRIYLKNSYQVTGKLYDPKVYPKMDEDAFWFTDKDGKEKLISFDFISTMERA